MLRPGGLLWLLFHEMRISWRGWMAGTKAAGIWRIVLYVAMAAGLLGAGFGIAALLGVFEPTPTPQVLGVAGAVYALIGTFMLSQALILVTDSLYQRGDLDLLLASPLPPWRILLVRMGAIALNVGLLYIALLLAVCVWMPFTGALGWLGILPATFMLALLATAIGLVVARVLFALIGPRATRVAAQVLAALIGAAFFLSTQLQNFVPFEQRGEAYARLLAVLVEFFGREGSMLSLPARAALGNPLALAGWMGLCIGAYGLAVWWFARRFVDNAAAVAGMSGLRKRDSRTRAFRGGLVATLVRKEWRLLLRDPLTLSQVLLQIIYLLPVIFLVFRDLWGGTLSREMVALFSSFFVLISSTLASSLVWITVSAEDAPDLIAAAPAPRTLVERGKAIAAGLPVAVVMLAPAAAAALVAPMAGVWLFIGCCAAITTSSLVGIWYQQPGSRKDFRKRRGRSLGTAFGQMILTSAWAGATGLAVLGWAILGIIPAVIALGVLLALHESRTIPQPG